MQTADLSKRICDYVDRIDPNGAGCATPIPGFYLVRSYAPSAMDGVVYKPMMCLILQGAKETTVGDHTLTFGAGDSLIVSHDLPIMARITQATPKIPYVCLAMTLDLAVIRSLYDEIETPTGTPPPACALEVARSDAALIDATARLFDLTTCPQEARVMAPLITREIHFRLLMAKHGGMLRELLRRDSHASRISKAITAIRAGFAAPLAVTDLATTAGMSASSFHEHFKAVTATTPLQFQKDLRLMHARGLVRAGAHSVSSAAFEVGYESPTQFSREYSRKFGVTPRQDQTAA